MKSTFNYILLLVLLVVSCDAHISYDDYYNDMDETVQAIPANDFLESIGVNTAFYERGEYLEKSIEIVRYLGIRWIRSGYQTDLSVVTANHERVFRETGVKFSIGLGSGGSDIDAVVNTSRYLAEIGALVAIEGNNEPNNWGIEYEGQQGGGSHSWLPVARLHRDMYAAVKNDPVLKEYPVWGLSETGAETDNVGLQYLTIPDGANTLMPDGTVYADYANCHNYITHPGWPGIHNNQTWLSSDPTENAPVDGLYDNYGLTWQNKFEGYTNEQLKALPRATTETGVTLDDDVDEDLQGRLYVNLYLSQFKRGWSYTSIYIMRDRVDEAGNQTFGMYRPDYTPRPAAHYLHNMTTILADDSSIENPGSLSYTIPRKPSTVHHMLLQRNDGRFMLVLWGERFEGGQDDITVNFGQHFSQVNVYNPIESEFPVETVYNSRTVPLTMTTHPYILELID